MGPGRISFLALWLRRSDVWLVAPQQGLQHLMGARQCHQDKVRSSKCRNRLSLVHGRKARPGSIAPMKTLCAAAAVLVLVGCGRTVGPPPPLPVEQIPTEIKKVFGKAKPEVNDLITTISSTLQAKDYAAAYQAVQILCNLPDETKDQR